MVMIGVNSKTGREIVMRRMAITDAMPTRNPRLKIDPLFAPGGDWATLADVKGPGTSL